MKSQAPSQSESKITTNTSNKPPVNSGISLLASQFMDMFDSSKFDPNLLGKRTSPSLEESLEANIQKKLKTPLNSQNFPSNPFLQNLNNFMVQPSFPPVLNPTTFLGQDLALPNLLGNDILRMQHFQNYKLLYSLHQEQKQRLEASRNDLLNTVSLFDNKGKVPVNTTKTLQAQLGIDVKEEYVKQEEPPVVKVAQKSLERTALKAAARKKINKEKKTPLIQKESLPPSSEEVQNNDVNSKSLLENGEEPALLEYTRVFPDWDLATIFKFLRSGKAFGTFEQRRGQRLEKKLSTLKR